MQNKVKNNLYLVGAGFLFLFLGAFFDSTRGPLLPLITHELGLSYGSSSWLLVLGNFVSVFVVGLMFYLLNRLAEETIGFVTIAIGLATIGFGFFVGSYQSLLIFAMLLGICAAGLGLMSNVLTIKGASLSSQGRVLSGLHTMYGVSSMCATFVMGSFIDFNLDWPWVFTALLPISLIVLLLLLRQVSQERNIRTQPVTPQSSKLSFSQVLILLSFSIYVSGEVLTSMWLPTFLVEDAGLSVGSASRYVSGFFAVLSMTRLLCFFVLLKKYHMLMLYGSIILGIISFIVGRLFALPAAFCFAGVIGPFFPVFLAEVSSNYPHQWRSLTVWIIFSMQILLASFHLIMGQVTQFVNIATAYWAPPILLVTAIIILPFLFKDGGTHATE